MGINILIYCCKLYGAVVFLACFVLGWTLVSVQLKQAEYIFPNTEKPSTYRITLTTKPEIKKNSILFRVALRGEVLKDTFLYNFSEKTFLFYFPKDSAAYSLKRGDELLVCTYVPDIGVRLVATALSLFVSRLWSAGAGWLLYIGTWGFGEMNWRYSLRLQ